MASFDVHQDAEKENPRMQLRDKKSNILQPSALGVGGGAGVLAAKQLKQQHHTVRPTFAAKNTSRTVVGSNNNNNNKKVALRDVGNVKAKEENVAKNVAKKSTVVPVVEQFKTFSVYEDQNDDVSQQQQQQQIQQQKQHDVIVDKENVYTETQRRVLAEGEIFVHSAIDYALDATPMSVSDILSPMSVDVSQTKNLISLKSIDDSNFQNVAEDDKVDQQGRKLAPRNDRQRFFEVLEYQEDILDYFRDSEQKHRPKPYYMKRQSDINNSMRIILVDWLVEVSEEYNLDTETLYLSISYIDRFLSHMSVVRSKLQLVGTAAMFIAAKYEEIYPPDVGEFVFITDDTYSKAQVLRMEQIILKILAFDLCTPTAYVYLNSYAVITGMPEKLKFLTQYICELSLLEVDPYLRFLPSIISSAALALSRYILDYPIWSKELEKMTKYRLEDLKEVMLYLSRTHCGALSMAQQAIPEKYKSEKYKLVSTIPAIDMNEEMFEELLRRYHETLSSEGDDMKPATATSTTTTTKNENVRKMISVMFN